MSELPPKVTPTVKSSATKSVSTSSSQLQTGALVQQQKQAQTSLHAQRQQPKKQQQQKQQKRYQQEVSLADRTRASPPSTRKSTAPPKESRPTSRPGSSKGSNEGTEEDPSDPVVVSFEGPDRFYTFAEKGKMWDYVMKGVELQIGAKKPGVKQPAGEAARGEEMKGAHIRSFKSLPGHPGKDVREGGEDKQFHP